MLLSVALFCALLFVPAALGLPSGLDAPITRRREGRQSQVGNRLDPVDGSDFSARAVYTTEYSSNWSGAFWSEANGTFTSVVGTFIVPTVSGASGTSTTACVGIDGITCHAALFRTGVDFGVSSDGQPTYNAWWQWFPEIAQDFSGISISAGDTIELSLIVYATTMGSGFVTIWNRSNGQIASVDVGSSTPLCGQNAEWIVQNYDQNGSPLPLNNFGTVAFTDAAASGSGGTYTPSGATLVELYQNNQILTFVSTSDSSVTIQQTVVR